MNTVAAFGRILFAAAMIGFGIQHVLTRGIVIGVELVPPWPPSHLIWGYITATLLLICGLCVLLNRLAVVSAYLLAALFLNAVILLDLPRVRANLLDLTARTRFFETLAFAAGALIIAGVVARGGRTSGLWRTLQICALIGAWLYAISLVTFGITHFLVPGFIATLIPKWIPWHLYLAYFTGAAFIAAAISIVTKTLARTSACLLGILFLAWAAMLHEPRIAAALHNSAEWNSGIVALGMAGCAFALCGSTAVRK